jgi:hypothetical protein
MISSLIRRMTRFLSTTVKTVADMVFTPRRPSVSMRRQISS